MFTSGFQSFAFQTVGTGGASAPIPVYNGRRDREYTPYHYEIDKPQKKAEDVEFDLISTQYKIDDLEIKRLHELSDQNMQLELLLLIKEEQRLMELLAYLQAKELLRRNNEDAILILMMCINN